MKNKLILFDWGNIVESFTTGYTCIDAWNDLFISCGYKGKEAAYNKLHKYKLTRIKDYQEFEKVYEQMKTDFNLNKSFDEFIDIYKDTFDKVYYYKDVSEYEKSLKDKCYIGIFSNLTIFDKERLDKQVDLSKYDYVFLSYEMGLRKPEIEIYNKVQSNLPFKPADILFIDDKLANVESASKIGWNVLQTTGLELDKIKQTCEDFLNK